MRKNRLLFPLYTLALSLAFTACEETTGVNEYANWQNRNTAYMDSIAKIARTNADGNWKTILSFKLDASDSEGNTTQWGNEDYVYCHVETAGTGTTSPLFTDTVLVNYRGRLIPTDSYPEGMVFDQSYKGVLNPAVDHPSKFSCGAVIVGWSTALQKMVAGDVWTVYIPADLAYGSSKQSSIPAYSALTFTINLTSFSPIGTVVKN